MRRLLNLLASRIKGESYALDESIPVFYLFCIGFRRLVLLVRGFWFFPSLRGRVFVGSGVVVRNSKFVKLGSAVSIGNGVLIDGLSKKGVSIGNNVSIGPHTIIQASGVFSRLGTGCSIGNNSGIGAFSFIGAGGGVWIGDDVIMGQYVSFHSENHLYSSVDVPIRVQGVERKGIVIGNDCWVGAKTTFLDGAKVGKGCVIAAGSVVRGEIPDFSVIGGVPAKVIKTRLSTRG